jgi:hypothetical protein
MASVRNKRSEADRIRSDGDVIEFTIANNQALSDKKRLHGRRVVAIEMPDDWDTAEISFLSGSEEAALLPVYDDEGNEVTVTVAADRVVSVTGWKADAIMSLDWLQLRSGTVGVPVNQSPARTLKLLVK